MEPQEAVLTFFVDALLNYEEQKPNSFHVNGWLLLQLLLVRSPDEASNDGLDLSRIWPNTTTYQELAAKVESILEEAQTDWDTAVTDDQQEAILDIYGDQLLQAITGYFPYFFVPDDWRLHWMGVEG